MIPDSVRLPLRELRELGVKGTLFRLRWEAGRRLRPRRGAISPAGPRAHARLVLRDAEQAADAAAAVMAPAHRTALLSRVERLDQGELRMFSHWFAAVGSPPQWKTDPVSGHQWATDFRRHPNDDVKFVWEMGRFPHAWDLMRAAAVDRAEAGSYAARLRRDVSDFRRQCPAGEGVQWASGQEAAIRFVTLWFADAALQAMTRTPVLEGELGALAAETAQVIERDLDYARFAVYNNHLLWESLGLYAAGVCVADYPKAGDWRNLGRQLLIEQSDRQFYEDGGYIQQSHTYHRMAMQALLMACLISRTEGVAPAGEWHAALARSVGFLAAQMNVADGRLSNYGANDGALPLILSECDYADFRPTLTAASIEAQGCRPFDAGEWDEEAVWLFGPARVQAATPECPSLASRRFDATGLHVLREDRGTFAAFRCGTLRDRFSQIDMLHVDLWWRGQNVLIDPGSYRYNGAPEWHNHFMRTAAHNTVTVDGLDQMVHYRQFKCLYPAEARLLAFSARTDREVAVGEHLGYVRRVHGCAHRRSVLRVGGDLWIAVDHITGSGPRDVRLHWLGGAFAWSEAPEANGFELQTSAGTFVAHVFDDHARPVQGDVVAGTVDPPRGWLSRYYGKKIPTPSFAATRQADLPLTLISVLAGCAYELEADDDMFVVRTPTEDVTFVVRDGMASFGPA